MAPSLSTPTRASRSAIDCFEIINATNDCLHGREARFCDREIMLSAVLIYLYAREINLIWHRNLANCFSLKII